MLIRRSAPEPHDRLSTTAPAPFIVGVERSGTTLLRLMLDAHPALAIPGETWFIPTLVKSCADARDPRAEFYAALTSDERWPIFHLDEDRLAERVAPIDPFDLGDAVRAFYQLYAERFGKPRWGNKSPGYTPHMVIIQSLLPEARFIHIIRDGRDVALSIQRWRRGADASTIGDLAVRWMLRISVARYQLTDLRHYLEIRYEDLILRPEATMRIVADFIDLPWESAMLHYYEKAEERLLEYLSAPPSLLTALGGDPLAKHTLTSGPPRPERIGAWRRDMAVSDQLQFAEAAGETLREFGYPLEPDASYPGAVHTETIDG
jgi:hypothetical protein